MNRIATFVQRDIANLSKLGIAQLHVELNDDGTPHRELGLNATGSIVRRHPGHPTLARHGLFDLQRVEAASAAGDLSAADFSALWGK